MTDQKDKDNLNQIGLKILIIGDSRVGKTSLLLKYVDNIFPEEHIGTIGVEYKDKYVKRGNFNIRLSIWDTAGQERFRSITKNIYRNANGVLFVYDITNKKSFENIRNWIKDTQKIDKDIKGIILGNKIDLNNIKEVGKDYLEDLGAKFKMPVLEVSAKDNINVVEVFNLIIEELLKDKTEEEIMEMYSRKNKSDLSISTKKTNVQQKTGCC